jgi:hypothetical protein
MNVTLVNMLMAAYTLESKGALEGYWWNRLLLDDIRLITNCKEIGYAHYNSIL